MCCISINTTVDRTGAGGSTVKDNHTKNNTQPNEGITDLVLFGLLKILFTVTHIYKTPNVCTDILYNQAGQAVLKCIYDFRK